MRVLKRALAIVYLAAAVVALGTLVCQFWGPYTYRFMLLMRDPLPRIVVTACGHRARRPGCGLPSYRDAATYRGGLRHYARHAGHDCARSFFAVQDYRPDRGGFR